MKQSAADSFTDTIGHIDTYDLLKEGQNAFVYKVTSENTPYIVRVGYDQKDSGSSLATTAAVLDFLDKAAYPFAPRKIFYDEKTDVLCETFLVGEQKPIKDYSYDELKVLVDALVALYKIPVSINTEIPRTSALEEIKIYGIDRLELVKETLPDQSELITWLQMELDKNILALSLSKEVESTRHIVHGDLGNNMMLNEGNVFFIDWEHGRAASSYELCYLKIHSHLSNEQFSFICKYFSERMGLELEMIEKEIRKEEKIIRLNDVIWAAMRWGRTKTPNQPEGALSHRGNTFMQLMQDRKELYLNLQ